MKKISLYLIFTLFLSSCASLKTIIDVSLEETQESGTKVKFKNLVYQADSQLTKYKKAAQLVEKVLNSEDFKESILQGPAQQFYINKTDPENKTIKCEGDIRSTYTFNVVSGNCLTNQDILNKVLSKSWNLSVRINYRWWALWCAKPFINEVGHREGDLIVTQECQFERMSHEQLAGHLIHEHLHVIGFEHPYKDSKNRKYTVPYFIGNKAVELFKNSI